MVIQRDWWPAGQDKLNSAWSTPVALVIADLPAMMVRFEVTRKRATVTHQIYWNAVAKSLEPMVCSRCGCDCNTVYFTDDTVAPLCPTCFDS